MSEVDWQAVRQQLQASEAELQYKASRDPALWTELLSQRAKQLQRREQSEHIETRAYLSFETHAQALLLDIKALKSVQAFSGCTPLPKAPAALLGVCNHRGQMLSVLELAELLELPGKAPTGGFIIFVRSQPGLGLRVAKLQEIVWLEAGDLSPQPEGASPYLDGMTQSGQLVLSLERLLTHPLLKSTSRSKS